MKQQVPPAVVVVVVLIAVGIAVFAGMKVLGKHEDNSSQAKANPRYQAYEKHLQDMKK